VRGVRELEKQQHTDRVHMADVQCIPAMVAFDIASIAPSAAQLGL